MSLSTTITFDNPHNFNYEIEKIDFTRGAIIGMPPINRIFCAKFLDNVNGRDSDNQEITGESLNNPVIEYNRLKLDSSLSNAVKFSFSDFINITNTGSFIFKFIPLYDNAPSSIKMLFDCSASNNNKIHLLHSTNGKLYFSVYSNNSILFEISADFNCVANREYLLECNFDLINNKLRVFIDGIKTEIAISGNYERDGLSDFVIGRDYNGNYPADGYIRDFAIFSSIIHTDDYEDDLSDYNRNYAEYYEITGASLQKSGDFSFLVNFKNHGATELDADYAEGSATATPVNNPQVVSGMLDLAHDDIRYVDWEFEDNFKTMTEGCVKFGYIPNYSSTPSKIRFLFQSGNFNSPYEDSIYIYHSTNQALTVGIRDMYGVTYYVYYIWYPAQGREYHFEFNWSVIKKKFWVYIDGQKIIEKPLLDNFTRALNGNKIRLGSSAGGDYESNQSYTYLQILKQNSHDVLITNFIDYDKSAQMAYPIQEANYIEPKSKILTDGLKNVDGTVVDTTDGDRRYIVVRDSDLLYWDGSQWTTSDGTWAQANNPATLITNLSSLDLSSGYNCTFRVLLRSETGVNTDEIQSIVIDYNFYGGDASNLDTCTVYGYIYDFNNQPLSNADIYIKLIDDATEGKKIFPDKYTIKTTTNNSGYFEIDLVPNSSISPTSGYQFSIEKYNFSLKVNKVVPNSISANFNDMAAYS